MTNEEILEKWNGGLNGTMILIPGSYAWDRLLMLAQMARQQGAAEQREKDEALLRETGEHLVRLGHVQAGQQIIATCDLWKFNDAEAIRTQDEEGKK